MHCTDLNNYYLHLLHEFGGEEFDGTVSTTQTLEEKVKKHYADSLRIIHGTTKRGNIFSVIDCP